MIEPIVTAGLGIQLAPASNPRRDLVKGIRAVLRRQDATEDEDVDALEALIELSKE
jgi:hypothetical protein